MEMPLCQDSMAPHQAVAAGPTPGRGRMGIEVGNRKEVSQTSRTGSLTFPQKP